MHDVENVASDAAFWTALGIGAVGTALVWFRLRHGHHEPGVAIVVIVACAAGLRVDHLLAAALVVGLALLLAGEWLTRGLAALPRAVAAVPGALVLGAALPDGWPFWVRAVVSASTVVGGALVDAADRVVPRWVPLLLAIGAIGVYACVPDTEAPKALMGALVAGACLGFAPSVLPALGATTLTGLFVWIAAFGGVGRPGSVVGGIACLGVVVLVPLVRGVMQSRAGVIALAVVQCALVLYVSRVAGFEDSAWSALALCVPGFAIAGFVLALTTRLRRAGEP